MSTISSVDWESDVGREGEVSELIESLDHSILHSVYDDDIAQLTTLLGLDDTSDTHGNPNPNPDPSVNVNECAGNGWSVLHRAAYMGQIEAVGAILAKGSADLESRTDFGQTPLFCACVAGHTNVVRLLMSHGAQVSVTDKNGSNTLHVSAESGLWGEGEAVRALWNDCDIEVLDTHGDTPMHRAAALGRTGAVQALVIAGGSVNAKNLVGRKPLHLASAHSNVRCVQALLDASANVDARCRFGETALFLACRNGLAKNIRCLVDGGADVNTQSVDGKRPLHALVEQKTSDAVRALVELGGDINMQCQDGMLPLHYYARDGLRPSVQAILEMHSDPGVLRRHVNNTCIFGRSPLHYACEENHTHIVSDLIEAGADFNVTCLYGESPLHLAAAKANSRVTKKILLGRHKKVLFDKPNQDGRTPFLLAALSGDCESASLLLKIGASLEAVDVVGQTALHLAALNGHVKMGMALLRLGMKFRDDKNGYLPLHSAVSTRSANVEFVQLLFDNGAQPNPLTFALEVPLHLAAKNALYDCADLIQEEGGGNLQDVHKHTPIFYADAVGAHDIVDLLNRGSEKRLKILQNTKKEALPPKA